MISPDVRAKNPYIINMGATLTAAAVAEVLATLSCETCTKFNEMDCESECCDLCSIHYHTEVTDVTEPSL